LGIETVFATKRTTVECHKRGDALAIYREAVAVDANEWGGLGKFSIEVQKFEGFQAL